MSRAPLVLATLALAAGIAAGMQRPVPTWDGPLLFGLILGAALQAWWWTAGRGRTGGVILIAIALTGAALGLVGRARADGSCAARLPADTALEVEADVLTVRGDRLELRTRHVRVLAVPIRCEAVLSARWDGRAVAAGSRVTLGGRWWRPPGRATVGGRGLLLVDRVAPVADTIGARDGSGALDRPAGRLTTRVQDAAAARLERYYGDHAPLAASLLLARREGLDPAVRDRFARAGLSHLLAISGLHVGLVAGVLVLLARATRLPRPWMPWIAGSGTVAYVLFLGAPHSAVRAAIQIVLVLGARALQRPTHTQSLIATAALVVLALDPLALAAPGFQLSFAGVIGIVVLRRPLLRLAKPLAGWRPAGLTAGRWLADGLATSLAATLATAPIVAWHFGRVAPVGILANLTAIPLLAAAVPALALSLLLGAVLEDAGRFVAGGSALLLAGLDRTATAAAAVPAGSVAVPPSAALLLTGAVAVGYLASRRLGAVRPGLRAAVWCATALAVWLVAPLRPAGDVVEIHVIDVGQGDAIAVRSPAGRWLLVDAGIAGQGYDAGERRVVPYLGRRGVRRLEGLVLTHPDADHIGGAAAVVRTLRPRWIGDPAAPVGKAGYLALLQAAEGRGVPWVGLRDGVTMDLDGMTVEFLHPPVSAGHVVDANEASVVLRLEYGEFSALLTGDASLAVEDRLVGRYGARLEAEVLKVGHHGSLTSTGSALLEAATPDVALISAGRGNRYGHPHRVVLERLTAHGVRVHRTDREGSLVVRGDARGGLRIHTDRGDAR